MIPVKLQKDEVRFCLLKKKDKIPFEKNWQNNGYKYNDQKLLKHIYAGGNYGVIGGYGNLRIWDFDDIEFYNEIKDKLPESFLVMTGSGGHHYYFFSDYDDNKVFAGKGELRCKNYQCVGAGSIHPNGKQYKVLRNLEITQIPSDTIRSIITPYLEPEKIDQNIVPDQKTRSEIEMKEVCKLIKKGKTIQEIFEHMKAFAKWTNSSEQYKNITYIKSLEFMNQVDKSQAQVDKKVDKSPDVFVDDKKIKEGLLSILSIFCGEYRKEIIGEKKTIEYLIFVLFSKKLINKNPLSFHTLINSNSGAGKDFIIMKIIKSLEKFEEYENYTRISARALDYLHTGKHELDFSWDNKIIVLNDIDDDILNSSTLKLFLSEGTETAIVNQGMVQIRKVKGKPIVIMTSAYSDPNREQLRRINILNLDETIQQTKDILIHQSTNNTHKIDYKLLKSIFNKVDEYEVEIPFALEIVDKISHDDVFMRTFFNKILDFTKVSTIINQKRRKKNNNNKLMAEKEDYCYAKKILDQLCTGINFKPLSLAKKEFLECIKHDFATEWFTMQDLMRITGLSYNPCYKQINYFLKEGMISSKREIQDYGRPVNMYHLIEKPNISLPEIDIIDTVKTIDRIDRIDKSPSLSTKNNEEGKRLLHDSDKTLGDNGK